jgi:hypothetical protein
VSACPRLRIVATSRKRLGLDGEYQVTLGSLVDDAVALFRVPRPCGAAGFTIDTAQLIELCRRLDGLSLAIEAGGLPDEVAAPVRGPVGWSSCYAAWGWLTVQVWANSDGVSSPWAVWGRCSL